MKILVINGGMRLGNTWKLTSLVKEYIKSLDKEIDFEELHLKDINLPFCLGCSLCFRKGHEYCPHNQQIQLVMDKIEESDGIIFSAPTYYMQMPALTKNFIDHLSFMFHRPRYFSKKALVISTTGGVGAKKATNYMSATMIGWGFNRCYQLPVSAISWNDYHPKESDKRKSFTTARKFYADLVSGKLHVPSFSALIPYNLFRGMSFDYRKGTKYEIRDGSFWEETGLIDKTYSPMVPLPVYKKLFGNMFYLLAKMISKRMIVTYKK